MKITDEMYHFWRQITRSISFNDNMIKKFTTNTDLIYIHTISPAKRHLLQWSLHRVGVVFYYLISRNISAHFTELARLQRRGWRKRQRWAADDKRDILPFFLFLEKHWVIITGRTIARVLVIQLHIPFCGIYVFYFCGIDVGFFYFCGIDVFYFCGIDVNAFFKIFPKWIQYVHNLVMKLFLIYLFLHSWNAKRMCSVFKW